MSAGAGDRQTDRRCRWGRVRAPPSACWQMGCGALRLQARHLGKVLGTVRTARIARIADGLGELPAEGSNYTQTRPFPPPERSIEEGSLPYCTRLYTAWLPPTSLAIFSSALLLDCHELYNTTTPQPRRYSLSRLHDADHVFASAHALLSCRP